MTSAQYYGLLAAIQAGTVATAGTIIMFGGASTPSGYLLCDGSAVSRTTYATLFAAISTAWGVGDGVTTFNLPDLRGRGPIGVGTGTGLTARVLGTNYGAETPKVTQAVLDAFALTVTDPGHTHDVAVSQDALALPGQNNVQGQSTGVSPGSVLAAATSGATGISVTTGGSGTGLSVIQPVAGVNYFVKT